MINDGPEQSHKQGKVAKTRQKTLIKKGQEIYEDTINAFSGQLRKKQKCTEEQIVAFTQSPLHMDAEIVKRGLIITRPYQTFFRDIDTRIKESECELTTHIMVFKETRPK